MILAVGVDKFAPDRLRVEPLAWFRRFAAAIEKRFQGGNRAHGTVAAVVAITPVLLLVLVVRYVFAELGWILRFAFDVIVLAWCLNLYRLSDCANEISEALQTADMSAANENLRLLVDGSPDELSEAAIARSTVEAVLKQANTVIIAPLFWFILLGPVGAVLQRLANLLSRSWGQRNERLAEFGWAAERLDDVLGWIPARITALSYAIMGSFEDALRCWRYQVGLWSASQSGPVLASGLGALQMQSCDELTGNEDRKGKVAVTTVVPDAGHVRRVVALVWRVLLFWVTTAVCLLVLRVVVV
ncbi:MAG: cobalamin biosynthesis protein [Acidiferrobacterales bacterium]